MQYHCHPQLEALYFRQQIKRANKQLNINCTLPLDITWLRLLPYKQAGPLLAPKSALVNKCASEHVFEKGPKRRALGQDRPKVGVEKRMR